MEKYFIKPEKFDKSKDLVFQIIEWYSGDEFHDDTDTDNEDDIDSKNILKADYIINCFGVTTEGKSITCRIENFKPFYYVRVPDTFTRANLKNFTDFVENSWMFRKFKKDCESDEPLYVLARNKGMCRCSLVERKDIYGFQNNKKHKFVQLFFNNYACFSKSRYIFKSPIKIPGIDNKLHKYKLYESNFEPFMRFCHIKDIKMGGWAKITGGKYKIISDYANTRLTVAIDRTVIERVDSNSIGNFLQM